MSLFSVQLKIKYIINLLELINRFQVNVKITVVSYSFRAVGIEV